jgi:cytochrome bd-type quinol oxidase subunit 2
VAAWELELSERISVAHGQWRLAFVWMTGVGISFAVLLAQTMGQKYGDQYQKAWSWFLPTVIPILTLIIGSLVYQAKTNGDAATVDKRMYLVSMVFSAFYLVLVLGVLVSTAFPGVPPLEKMSQSQLWLTPIQALTSSALGAFFVSKRD